MKMEELFRKHRILISATQTDIVRKIIEQIDWEKNLVAIRGSRGVGKTTLIRQYIKLKYGVNAGDALYCAMDSLYFSNHSLLELAERFHLMGGTHLFLDEVHRYDGWSKEVKEIIDLYPDLRITFTGSSLIQILNADADLSRRALSYTMSGLSFREFLLFYKGIELPSYTLSEILLNPDNICDGVNKLCRPQKMFEEYLRVGYYPFYDGNADEYYSRLENVITFIIEQEMPLFCGVEPAYTRKIKALLMFLSENVPFEVNVTKLASYLEINKLTVLSYLSALKRAEILNLLYCDNLSVKKMQKPDKLYLQNTNLMYALHRENNIGMVRECFALNQLSVAHEVEYGEKIGDFRVDGKVIFEVGGPDKSFDQIADVADSYILADGIEFPIGKKIPLWLVGMMY